MSIFEFIEKKSYHIANNIGKNDTIDDIELYGYSIFMILSNIFTIGTGILISLIFGYFKYFIISETSFIILRVVAGGSHCDTFKKCFFVSNIISILSCLIAIFSLNYSALMVLIAFSSCILIMPVCPKPSTNSPSRGYKEDIRFRRKFAYRCLILIFISIIAFNFDLLFITSSICSGILVVCFVVSDVGEIFIEKISGLF